MNSYDALKAQIESYNPELQWENIGGAHHPIFEASDGEDILWRALYLDPGVEVFRQHGCYTQTLECLVSDVSGAMRAMDAAEVELNASTSLQAEYRAAGCDQPT
jgi:hypothetical protein